jgi:hypothetical protein
VAKSQDLLPAARVGSNPSRTDVTVGESLSVYLWKVGYLFPNTLYNVSGFSLPLTKTDHHDITEKLLSMAINLKKNKSTISCLNPQNTQTTIPIDMYIGDLNLKQT